MKSLTVTLTVAVVLCLAGSAAGAYQDDLRTPDAVVPVVPATPVWQDLRTPDSVPPDVSAAPGWQDLRSPDSAAPIVLVAPPWQDLRTPDSVTPFESAPLLDAAPVNVTVPADGGLSPLVIVLLTLAGVAALAGAAYGGKRLAHAHHTPPVA